MRSAVIAGIVGAITAVVLAFLAVAVISASGGVPVLFQPDRNVSGWEGAQYGMRLFALLGIVMVWPLLVIALLGAIAGVMVRPGRGYHESESVSSLQM
jgi:hypothetical protein